MTPDEPSPEDDRRGVVGPDADFPALAWLRRARAEDELLIEVARQIRRRRQRRIVAASGMFAAVLVVGAIWNFTGGFRDTAAAAFQTATVSRPERQILPDQSIVELNADAQIEIDYNASARRIILRKGEAHFEVIKDSRPFVVQAGGVAVRALGTAFSVQLAARQVEVVVTEGQVQLIRMEDAAVTAGARAAQSAPPATGPADLPASESVVSAGHRAVMSVVQPTAQVDAVSESELADLQAWRTPVLEFSRTPLVEVIALMNRHATARQKMEFVIADAELRTVKLSGFLRTDNHIGLLRLLENQFEIRAEVSGNTIALHKTR